MLTIFDPLFSGMPHSDMYRNWVFGDLDPRQPRARLANWSDEEITMYCGTRKDFNAVV